MTTREASLRLQTPLLLTCHQISVEVASLMQAYRVVHLVNPIPLSYFAYLVGSEKCAELEEITINSRILLDMYMHLLLVSPMIGSSKKPLWDPYQTQHLFRRMQRVQVNYLEQTPPSESEIRCSRFFLRDLFGKDDLEVEWVASD